MSTSTESEAPPSSREFCSFCEELAGVDSISVPVVKAFFNKLHITSRILLESEKVFVVPSLGPLLRGHVLVLPKSHHFSIGELPPSDASEFELIAEGAKEIITRIYGACSAFEHGCVERGAKGGACVDHAHLHLLPLGKDLLSEIEKRYGAGRPVAALSDLKAFVGNKSPYLYYQRPDGRAVAVDVKDVPSQFFRQVVWRITREGETWDWKADLRPSVIQQTYETLREPFKDLEVKIYAARS